MTTPIAQRLPWEWDDRIKRYRDLVSGRFVAAKKLVQLRDTFVERVMSRSDALIDRLAGGEINVQQWVGEMRTLIRKTYMAEAEAAIGGRNAMTSADFGRVGGQLQRQYQYLNNFAEEMRNGKLSPGQARVRARMYINGATQAFERAKTHSAGIPDLPQYPGDGRTQCLSNCKCTWEIVDTETAWECTWSLGIAEHCDDCVSNASKWNPLMIQKVFA
jgi:hypothetical protein